MLGIGALMPGESKEPLRPFKVGNVRVYPDRNLFVGDPGEVRVEPRVMDLMCALASSSSGMMSREALIDMLWATEFGADEGLTRAVSRLRRALRDAGGAADDIETVPKRGYRLVVDIRPLSENDTGSALRRSPSRPWWQKVPAAVAGVVIVAVAVTVAFREPEVTGLDGADNSDEVVLAILPFDSQSANATDDHIAAALADEIQFSLAKNKSVSVIAGGSAFRFRDQKQDLKAITEVLNATHIVDGALRRTEDNIRVGVNLIDASSETIVWSTVVEHSDEEIYAIRDEVAIAILSELGRHDPNDCEGGTGQSHVPDSAAYDTYLQARALYRDGSKENLERAIAYLDSATRRDPQFVDAWATLAMAELNKIQYDFGDPRTPVPAARRAARRALELSPCSVDARLAMAIADWRERSKPVAESVVEFTDLLAGAPNSPAVLARMGMLYHELGRMNDSVRMWEKSYRLNPLSANTAGLYLWSLHMAGAWDKAEAIASATDERLPWAPNMYKQLEFPRLLAAKDYDAARVWIREFKPRDGLQLTPLMQMNSLLGEFVDVAENGGESEYRDVVTRLLAAAAENRIAYNFVFEFMAAAGFHDDAMELARERIASDDSWFRGSLFRPSLHEFRSNPAVFELFELNGLLEYWQSSGEWPDFCEEPDLPYDCRSVTNTPAGVSRY